MRDALLRSGEAGAAGALCRLQLPTMLKASPVPKMRAKSSSRNATRNAPASRRSMLGVWAVRSGVAL